MNNSKLNNLGFRLCKRCVSKATQQDTSGNYWCSDHLMWLEMMNWGKENGWPHLHTGTYGLAPGYDMWILVLGIGTQAMVEDFYAWIFDASKDDIDG